VSRSAASNDSVRSSAAIASASVSREAPTTTVHRRRAGPDRHREDFVVLARVADLRPGAGRPAQARGEPAGEEPRQRAFTRTMNDVNVGRRRVLRRPAQRVRERASKRRQPPPVHVGEIEPAVGQQRRNRAEPGADVAPAAAVVHELPSHADERVERRHAREIFGPPDRRRHVAAQISADD
jgi:hypothetical protein